MKIHPTIKILAFVTFALVISLTSAWVYLRNKGLSDSVSPVRHAFFDKTPNESVFVIADPSLKTDPVDLAQLKSAAALSPKLILWADVQITSDDQVVVVKQRDLALPDRNSRLVGLSTYEELIKILNKPVLKLADVLREIPQNRFVLNVRDYRPGLDGKLAQLIDEMKASDRVLIQSEQDGILRDLRTLRPTYLFGTSQAQVTQMLMLLSFGLEVVAPIKGDVYITTTLPGRPNLVSEEVTAEIHRRGRKVFAGPVDDLESAGKMRKLGVDGFISGNPEALVELLK